MTVRKVVLNSLFVPANVSLSANFELLTAGTRLLFVLASVNEDLAVLGPSKSHHIKLQVHRSVSRYAKQRSFG